MDFNTKVWSSRNGLNLIENNMGKNQRILMESIMKTFITRCSDFALNALYLNHAIFRWCFEEDLTDVNAGNRAALNSLICI